MQTPSDDLVLSRRWFSLAIASLVCASFFAIAIVVARLPVIDGGLDDPLFFRRCLVVHVTLSLCVWFYAFVAGLFHLVPAEPGSRRLHYASFMLACAGVCAILAGAGIRGPSRSW